MPVVDNTLLALSVGAVVTGSINTLTTKLADRTLSVGSDGGPARHFNHPFLQACGMFIGEALCLVAYYCLYGYHKWKNLEFETAKPFNPLLFAIPAMCDMTATSLMYIGLGLTHASVFQMLRGSVVIFTGTFSVLFLGRRLTCTHWMGMVCVLMGLLVVGLSSVLFDKGSSDDAPQPLVGDILVVAAQIVVAVQMVVEEKVLGKYNIPALQAVGMEGVFGFCILSLVLIPMYYIPNPIPVTDGDMTPGNRMENAPDGFAQMSHSAVVTLAILGNITSIAFFNFCGISVTKRASATTRMVLDSVRTFVIWGISLAVKWQDFQYLQVVGFVVLLAGMAVYYQVLDLLAPYLPCLPQAYEKLPATDVEDVDTHPNYAASINDGGR